jgi:GNAT superfamily N-acetyltransferase
MARQELLIRGVTSDDVEVISDLVGRLLEELIGGNTSDPMTLQRITQEVLGIETVTGLLAFEGQSPVGLIMLNECAAIYASGRFGEISELYVAPEHRSKGVAAQLVAEATVLGQRRDWKRLEVGAPTQPEWVRTVKFYLGIGFDEVGPRLRKLI